MRIWCPHIHFSLMGCFTLLFACGAQEAPTTQASPVPAVQAQPDPSNQPGVAELDQVQRLESAPLPAFLDELAIERVEELKRLQDLTNLSPGSYGAWLDLGMGYEAAGLRELAVRCYEQAHLRNAEDPKSWYRSGICNWRLGNFQPALLELARVQSIEPGYAPTYYRRGIVEMDFGDLDAAMRSFTDGIKVDPNYRGCYLGQARVFLQRDQPQEALDTLNPLAEKYPGDVKINNMLVTALRQAGMESERVVIDGPYPGDSPDPNWGDPWQLEMGSFKMRSFKSSIRKMLDELGQAESALDLMLERNQSDPDDWSYVGLQARALFLLKRMNEIEELYTRFLEIEPNSVTARLQLAYYLEAGGMPEKSVSWLDKALRLDPRNKKAWIAKGRILCLASQFEAGYLALKKAQELEPQSLEITFWMLKALVGLQRWEDSIPLFRRFVAGDPDNADVWLDFARARVKLHKFAKAERALDRALELNVGRENTVKRLRDLLDRNDERVRRFKQNQNR